MLAIVSPDRIKLFYDLLNVVLAVVLGLGGVGVILNFVFRKEIRAIFNIRKKIYVFDFTDENEGIPVHKMLVKNKIFRVYEQILKPNLKLIDSTLQSSSNKSTYVIIYEDTNPSRYTEIYQYLVERAKSFGIALIVFSERVVEKKVDNQGIEKEQLVERRISTEHMKEFLKWNYYDMVNTKSRLLTTILNMSMIVPTKGINDKDV